MPTLFGGFVAQEMIGFCKKTLRGIVRLLIIGESFFNSEYEKDHELQQARRVEKITVLSELNSQILSIERQRKHLPIPAEYGVFFIPETHMKEIYKNGIAVTNASERKIALAVDSIIISIGFTSREKAVEKAIDKAFNLYPAVTVLNGRLYEDRDSRRI